ncbi:MAG: DUF427 domain-containing protein [Candidatus Bathyarchaeia archaeon]
MAKALWNNVVVAESDNHDVVLLEGNVYFPPEAIKKEYFKPSETHTTCGWKGQASYYDIVIDGKKNTDAAWYYPEPQKAAEKIQGYVAFWNGVEVEVGGQISQEPTEGSCATD